jgi:hypothetical protein
MRITILLENYKISLEGFVQNPIILKVVQKVQNKYDVNADLFR